MDAFNKINLGGRTVESFHAILLEIKYIEKYDGVIAAN